MTSTNRTIPRERRRADTKGPDGKRYCRWCQGEVKPPKRTFCSQACVHEWRLRSDPGYMRWRVFERDRGVCAACGLDTEALRPLIRQAGREVRLWPREGYEERVTQRLREMGIVIPGEVPRNRLSLWDADHIVPVVEGGGECDLSNIRTLCVWCHRQETAKLAKRLRRNRA